MSISRISTYQLNKAFSNQVNNTQSKFNKLSEQIASGIKVSSTADNPVAARGIIKANKQLEDLELYKENIKKADGELSTVDTTLKSINDQLAKAYDIAMEVANGTMGPDEITAFQSDLDAVIANVKNLANTKYNDQYLFSGTRTTTIPYSENDTEGLIYKGNSEMRYAIVGENATQEINFIGKNVFGEASFTTDAEGNITFDPNASSGVFGALYELKAAIQDENNVDVNKIHSAMGNINTSVETVTGARTRTGAIGNSFDDMLTTYENDTINVKELRSNLQDTDLSSAISDWYSTYQSMQASFSMMSKSLDVSLLNYI